MFQSRVSLPHNMYPSDSYPAPSGAEAPHNVNGRHQSIQLDSFGDATSQVCVFLCFESDKFRVVNFGFDLTPNHRAGLLVLGGRST